MATVKRELTMNFTSEEAIHHNKISITGTGSVGMACAISILLKGSSDELTFGDADEGKLMGETVDLHHGSPFVKMPNIVSSKVPVWSGVNTARVPLKDLSADTGTAKTPSSGRPFTEKELPVATRCLK